MKIDLVGGARPNFMKLGPIYREMKNHKNFEPRFIHTGQHVDNAMTKATWDALGLPEPVMTLAKNDYINQMSFLGTMISQYDLILRKGPKPEIILVVGDTDSSLAATIVAKRNVIPVVHVEAGLIGDPDEPEEFNRRMIDSIADLMFTPTMASLENLCKKRSMQKIYRVGNVMADALRILINSKKWDKIEYINCAVLVTLHRPYNVDNPKKLLNILSAFDGIHEKMKICFPVHPRTVKRIHGFGIPWRPYFYDAMPYDKFIKTVANTKIVVTDSGGLQPEAAYLGTPCVALMNQTGWPHLLKSGDVRLCKKPGDISMTMLELLRNQNSGITEGLDGYAAKRICNLIDDWSKKGFIKTWIAE
jgi:UDP-N-acetylglucosamine 2-epimerase (non-hydrolysing)